MSDAQDDDEVFLEPVERAATASELRYLRLIREMSKSSLRMHVQRFTRLPIIVCLISAICWLTLAFSEGADFTIISVFGLVGLGLVYLVVRDIRGETARTQAQLSSAIHGGKVHAFVVNAESVCVYPGGKDASDIYLFGLEDGQTLFLHAKDFSAKKFPCLSFTLLHFLDEDSDTVWHHIRYRSSRVDELEEVSLNISRYDIEPMQVMPGQPSTYVNS